MVEGIDEKSIVFGLDIGTRSIVGTVGYKDDKTFHVLAQCVKEHETRAMLDGQIHDIAEVGKSIQFVKQQLERQLDIKLHDVCIAAAGRVLKTVTTEVEFEFEEEKIVTEEDIHTLDLLGVDKAQGILNENNDTKFDFYSVGYSTIHYYANGDMMTSLLGHKVHQIAEEVIVTFLPDDVVEGLYSSVGQAGLNVANMTLEPIAAINVAIPKSFRMLNIALVDVGAGTSDISITKDGSIIAYGMIPQAGDELTDVLVQKYLVDFNTADHMKIASGKDKTVEFQDILQITHQVSSEEIIETLQPTISQMTKAVAEKIKELNGNKSVSACFVVGGGGKVTAYTECLADELELIHERVALRGEEVLGDVVFEQPGTVKDSLLVTPIGICLSAYEKKNNFIFVHFNGERMKLYDNDKLTVVDAAVQAGFPNEDLFPKSGKELSFTVNGKQRLIRGGPGEAAVITLNGHPSSLGERLEANCEIQILASCAGTPATYTVGDIEEYADANLSFVVNGKMVLCPKFALVNGKLVSQFYDLHDMDKVELQNFYTVRQLMEFMDVEVDMNQDILVNNKDADMNTEVYENFSVDWKLVSFRTAQEDVEATTEDSTTQTGKQAASQTAKNQTESATSQSEKTGVSIVVNGEKIILTGKETYIFVDIFDKINFNLAEGKGRAIVTTLNGRDAQYTEALSEGDIAEIRWED